MNNGAETSRNSVKKNVRWLNAQSARHVVLIAHAHREHFNGIFNDMEAAERCGNSREASRLTRLLSGRRHTRIINPSKYISGDLLVTQDQLLDECIPPELVRGMFVMLHKKWPRDDHRNYRAICLLCHSNKLMYAIVARRPMTTLEDHLPDTQAGFRPARDCRDNVCALKWFIQMILREGRQAIITFIDYSAASDTESQMFLDEALAEAGVGAKVRRIVQAIFAAAIVVVRLRHPDGTMTFSEPFDIAIGVLQGTSSRPLHSSLDWTGSSGYMTSKTPVLQLAWARVRPSCRSLSTRMTPRSSKRMLRQRLPE